MQSVDTMWVPGMDVYLNHWFTDYDEAKAVHAKVGGYLFPYRSHFFVTVAGAVEELGLDPDDPDWQLIGFDWVRPADPEAWERLRVKRAATSE